MADREGIMQNVKKTFCSICSSKCMNPLRMPQRQNTILSSKTVFRRITILYAPVWTGIVKLFAQNL